MQKIWVDCWEKDLSEVKQKLEEIFTEDLKKAFATRDKQDRSNQISEITDKAKKLFEENENYSDLDVNSQLKNLEKKIVRTDILKNKNRIDGRGLSDVRPISCEVGVLPRTHGSALSLIHIWRCRRRGYCRSRWSPYQ